MAALLGHDFLCDCYDFLKMLFRGVLRGFYRRSFAYSFCFVRIAKKRYNRPHGALVHHWGGYDDAVFITLYIISAAVLKSAMRRTVCASYTFAVHA